MHKHGLGLVWVLGFLFWSSLLLQSSKSKPDSVFPVPSFHGFIKVGGDAADIFYWGFPSQSNPLTDPVVFWFNGGPGVSSILGLLEENGPFLLNNETSNLDINEWGWNKNSTLIFVDHPIGVGFSHGGIRDIPQTEWQNVPLMLEFFTTLVQIRPELANLDIYLFGESYAGHFVPFIAQSLLDSQQPVFKMKGIGLGNTLMNVELQYPEYSTFAYAPENRNYTNTSEELFELTSKQFTVCAATVKYTPAMVKDSVRRDFCQSIFYQLVLDEDGEEKFDVFDIRNPAPLTRKRVRAVEDGDTETFMNQPAVLNELQADKVFVEQTDGYFDVMTRRDLATYLSPPL